MTPTTRPPDHYIITWKDWSINRTRFSAITFAALFAAQAIAAGPIANGEIYPADAVAQTSTVTRAQVQADAARTGVLAQNGEIPHRLRSRPPASRAPKSAPNWLPPSAVAPC